MPNFQKYLTVEDIRPVLRKMFFTSLNAIKAIKQFKEFDITMKTDFEAFFDWSDGLNNIYGKYDKGTVCTKTN